VRRGYQGPACIPVPLQTPVPLEQRTKRAAATSAGKSKGKTISVVSRPTPEPYPNVKWRAVISLLVERSGGTQVALGLRLGISDSSIAGWASGARRPLKKHGQRLEEACRELLSEAEQRAVGLT